MDEFVVIYNSTNKELKELKALKVPKRFSKYLLYRVKNNKLLKDYVEMCYNDWKYLKEL